jgi:Tfp pilus assembly protein PilN
MRLRRLELDFVARPRRARWLGYLLLAVALVVAVDLVARYQAAQTQMERAATARGLLGDERRPTAALPRERLDEQLRAAHGVVQQLALPWAVMISTLEEAASPDVAVLQLQPEAPQGVLRITAEARNDAAMLDYLRRLAAARTLVDAHLLKHQVQSEDPQRPIQFSLQAGLAPAP